MTVLRFGRYAFGISFAVAVVSGCGESQPPIGTPQNPAVATRADRAGWMLRQAARENLLYVSGTSGNVYVYTYPKGQLVDTLSGFAGPAGECVDAAGDIFITSLKNKSSAETTIYEYAHGGTSPIKTLDDPGHALGCAVNQTTGNLAVANIYDPSNPYNSNFGSIAIYTNAQGDPALFYPKAFGVILCGYDNSGNLYVSGTISYSHQAQLARLAKGSNSFQPINLNVKIERTSIFPPFVQWDGKHMTISSNVAFGLPVILYRLAISGAKARVIGTTTLDTKKNDHEGQSWIQGRRVVGIFANRGWSNVALWQYPNGGRPDRSINHVLLRNIGDLTGIAISNVP